MPVLLFHILRAARYLSAALLALGLAGPVWADKITVFAAASLKTALDDIAPRFAAETGHVVTLSYAGTSALARQIALGAPADVFISANPGWMDYLAGQDLIVAGSRADIVANRLVLVAYGADAPGFPPEELPERLGKGYLAMALTDAVPAGVYGKAALAHFGAWQALADRVAQADNVRAALALVALGEAPYGIVYKSDAAAEPRVSVVALFPADSHPPILYPGAIVRGRDSPAARGFLTFLQGAAAQQVFARHGFTVTDEVGQ